MLLTELTKGALQSSNEESLKTGLVLNVKVISSFTHLVFFWRYFYLVLVFAGHSWPEQTEDFFFPRIVNQTPPLDKLQSASAAEDDLSLL